MPRLRNHDFLKRHDLLAKLWKQAPSSFGLLNPHQQRDLHAYFRSADDLSPVELLAHRQKITKSDPSLPNRAGKTFLLLLNRLTLANRGCPEPCGS